MLSNLPTIASWSTNHLKLFKLQSSKKSKNTSTIDLLPYSLSKRSIKKSFRINSWPSAWQATCCQSLLAYQSFLHHRFARWAGGTHAFGITMVSHSTRLQNFGPIKLDAICFWGDKIRKEIKCLLSNLNNGPLFILSALVASGFCAKVKESQNRK